MGRPAGAARGAPERWPARRIRARARKGACVLSVAMVLLGPVLLSAAPINRELTPGARLVFPYYDIRPGTETFLLLTNVGALPAGVQVSFYSHDCSQTDTRVSLSGHDIDLVDVRAILGPDPGAAALQGFVDVVTGTGDVLLGTAVIVNALQDWTVVYPAAASQQLVEGDAPYREFPTKLFVPALLTQGALGSDTVVDGLLILAAPNPAIPGGPIPEQPIQTTLIITDRDGRLVSRAVTGHHVILPIGELTQGLPPLDLAWIELQNRAVDDAGRPIGLVGLFIQNLVRGGGGGMATATRLWRVWCHPLFSTRP